MEGKVHRLTINLTTREMSEPEQFVFSLRDVIRSMDANLEPLWFEGPRQSAEQVRFHPLQLPWFWRER
jgi:hypothetical protein